MFNFTCHGRSVFYWCVFSAGWTLKGQGETDYITAHTGESVLLPCSCTDLNSSPDTFSWSKYNTTSYAWEEISSESDQYRNRVQLFNNLSPANLSLLISHLTEEDTGVYRCNLKMKKYRYYYITVKGCTLVNRFETFFTTAHAGESVLLPCSCTDLNSTPDAFSWKKHNTTSDTWEEISSESDQYRNRVQLFNNLSPANLSLLISHLTEEDAGYYLCYLAEHEYTSVKLTVAVPPQSLPFAPFALGTVIFLHIIVAVVYCTKKNKGTDLILKLFITFLLILIYRS
uniref:Ig-like domain-containing protein n=1 Tax=Astyanax mexicanus TaxID=7994 RepID=A0A3B1ILG1_ASTMX